MNRSLTTLIAALSLSQVQPAQAIEEPSFRLVEERDGYQLREYDAFIVAETQVRGGFRASGNDAFRALAGYIFGDNSRSKKMAMTVPVTSHLDPTARPGEPVYTWRFVMERQYDAKSLPQPANDAIRIVQVPATMIAARRYSGRTTQANFQEHLSELREALARDGRVEIGAPRAAVYNGPFTPFFLRRNEVLIEVAPDRIDSTDI